MNQNHTVNCLSGASLYRFICEAPLRTALFLVALVVGIALSASPAVAAAVSLDVTAYGATGDGVTDDRAAIQRAIDECAEGGTVSFPAGTYRLGSALYARGGVALVGTPGQSVLNMSAKSSATFILLCFNAEGMKVSGLGFQGSGYNKNVSGMALEQCQNVTIEDCRFDGLGYGIKIGESTKMSYGFKIEDIVMRDCQMGFFIQCLADSVFNRLNLACVYVYGGEGDSPAHWHDVYINADVHRLTFNNCVFTKASGWAIQLWGAHDMYQWSSTSGPITFNNTLIDVRNGRYPVCIGPKYSGVTFNNTTIKARDDTVYGDVVRVYGGSNVTFDGFSVDGGSCLAYVYSDSYSNYLFKNGVFDGEYWEYGDTLGRVQFENVSHSVAPTTTLSSTTTTMPPTTTTMAPTTTTTLSSTTTTMPPRTTTTAGSTTTTAAPPRTTTTSDLGVLPFDAAIVTMISPVDSSTVQRLGHVELGVVSETPVGRVLFYVDGRRVKLDYRAPYSFTLNAALAAPGSTHVIKGVAYDRQGQEIGSASSRVFITARTSRLAAETVTAMTGTNFPDLDSAASYAAAVSALAEVGVLSGFASGQVGADEATTRAQFAKMLALTLGIADEDNAETPFDDLGDMDVHGYPHKFVAPLSSIGIVEGIAPAVFSPYALVSRAQAVTAIVRAMGAFDPQALIVPSGNRLSVLGDFSLDHAWNMALAEACGLLAGLEDYGASWDPWVPAPRGEVAQLLINLVRLY